MNVEIYVFSNFLFKRKFSTVKHVAHCTAAQSRTNYSKIKGSEIFMPLSSFKPNPLIVLSRLFLFHHFFLPPFAHTHTHTHTIGKTVLLLSSFSTPVFISPCKKKQNDLPPSASPSSESSFVDGWDKNNRQLSEMRHVIGDTRLILFCGLSKRSCSNTSWFSVIDGDITESMTFIFWYNLPARVSSMAGIMSAQCSPPCPSP